MGPDATSRYSILYHLDNGLVLSSKDVHFNDVPLDKLTKIEIDFKYYSYRLDKSTLGPSFKEFIHYRSVVHTHRILGPQEREPVVYHTWTIGWTDHKNEYLDEYMCKTGTHVERKVIPRDFNSNPSHFHKDSLRIVNGNS